MIASLVTSRQIFISSRPEAFRDTPAFQNAPNLAPALAFAKEECDRMRDELRSRSIEIQTLRLEKLRAESLCLFLALLAGVLLDLVAVRP